MAKEQTFDADGAKHVAVAGEDGAWKRFVLVCGPGARNTDLAHVLGRTLAEVEALKRAGTGSRRGGRSVGFDALFEKWNGRPPRDDEWPLPRFYDGRGSYEWLPPEVAMLATLVGQLSAQDIAQALTVRLQQVTGDPKAKRDRTGVQNQVARLGLLSSDFLGGIAVPDAAREVGSYPLLSHAIRRGELRVRRIGTRLMIGHKAWAEWKAKIQAPPEGFVPLSTLKGPLGVRSDKLSEFSRQGYVPGAVQFKPFGTKGMHTTQFGSWYVPQDTADQLLADRREGRPMPWHGKPLLDNLKVTFRLWQERKHPKECEICAQIWGEAGAPVTFEEYLRRYPVLEHGAKRHLTMVWNPGITVAEVAQKSLRPDHHVRRAIATGALAATLVGRTHRITRTDATRWIARKCPTGDSEQSWLSFESAEKHYFFSEAELVDLCHRGVFNLKIGTNGAMRGVRYVLRQQCAQLRETIGFTEEQAAARAKVSVPEFRALLEGVEWRGAKGIPLSTLQAVIKRIQSHEGHTVAEASALLDVPAQWIEERIADGTVTVKRNKWDERLYLTAPMMARLRGAIGKPQARARLDANWLRLSDAAHLAGVAANTLMSWSEAGDIRRSHEANGIYYHQDDVRARARLYWPTARYRRARLPAWLVAEQQGAPAESGPPSSIGARVRAAAAARSDQAEVIVEDASTPLADLVIGWIAAPRCYLNTLKGLRARCRAVQGQASEGNARLGKLLSERFARLSDYDLVAFGDLDSATRAEVIQHAMEFVGATKDCFGAAQWARIAEAIAQRTGA